MENYRIEIWKDIVGYEGLYQISNFGRIKSVERVVIKKNDRKNYVKETVLRFGINTSGYYIVSLYKNAKPKTHRVHRIFATEFLPNYENKPNINHIDGDKLNNNLHNLEWVTQKENIQKAFETGLVNNTGVNNGQCVLNENKVLKIKKLLSAGETQSSIAKKYNVTRSCILKINLNKTWKHVILN